MHGLVFNRRHGLIICASCCIGLPLTHVSAHLSAETIDTWDDENDRMLEFKTRHPTLVGINTTKQKQAFKESLLKSLIEHDAIKSRKSVLDGTSNDSWRKNGDRIRTDGTPVQGVRTSQGYYCGKCSCIGRSYMFVMNHEHREGPHKDFKARTEDVLGPVEIQSFSELYKVFYTVNSWPAFLPRQMDLTVSNPSALRVLETEQSQMLKTLPDIMKSLGPQLKTLPPIYRDGGIETWLSLFDRDRLFSMLPQIPDAATQKKKSLYSKLRNAVFQLFAKDLQLLQAGIHPEIPHILTNGSRSVSLDL